MIIIITTIILTNNTVIYANILRLFIPRLIRCCYHWTLMSKKKVILNNTYVCVYIFYYWLFNLRLQIIFFLYFKVIKHLNFKITISETQQILLLMFIMN